MSLMNGIRKGITCLGLALFAFNDRKSSTNSLITRRRNISRICPRISRRNAQ